MDAEKKISVEYNIGFLAKLALENTSKMEQFKGLELQSEAIFYNNDETCFDGIRVLAIDKDDA